MPFSPSDISGLKIWLKADAGAGSSDGDAVGTWSDQSGGSHDFTQATAGSKPTYKVNIRNGLPVVRFDGGDDMSAGDLHTLFSTGGSVFWAGSVTSGTRLVGYVTGNNDAWWIFDGGSGYWGPFRGTRLSNTPSSGLDGSGWHVWSMTANNGTTYKVYRDGVNKINDTGGFTFTPGTGHGVGKQPTTGEHATAMDMGELIVYDSALNDTDRGSVETYLSGRWVAVNASASPAAVAGVGAVPAVTAKGNSTGSPAATAGVGAVPAPTVIGGSSPTSTPAAVAGIGAVPAATGKGNSTTTPSAVVGVGAVPAATATGGGTGTPGAVPGNGNVNGPFNVTGIGNVTPAVVAGVGTVPAPDTYALNPGVAHAPQVTGSGYVSDPTLLVTAVVTPAVVAGVGAVPSGTRTGTAVALPSVVAGVGTVPAATASGVMVSTAHPGVLVGVGAVPHPDAVGVGTGGGGGSVDGVTDYWILRGLE